MGTTEMPWMDGQGAHEQAATAVDVIVVGAGSAGCAAACRLAQGGKRVLLLEAGGAARNPLLHIPLGFAFLLKRHKANWNYQTQPEAALQGRCIPLPRGKVLGGCSAINGMVYVRGQAEDYDSWAAAGNEGWAYQNVLPYFMQSEDNENGANAFHGTGGPLWVGKVRSEFPVNKAFIDAAQQCGHPYNADINAATQTGVGFFPHNIRRGQRWSSASAFLGAAPASLVVITHAQVTKVLVDADKAVGVACRVRNQTVEYRAEQIVLCGGAINSPQLLECSGIGRRDVLERAGVPLLHALPGVGENLQDHWNAYIKQAVKPGVQSYYSESTPKRLLANVWRYATRRQGLLANPAALISVFYATQGEGRPDAQIHFAPASSHYDARGNMVPINGITVASCGLRPSSRGSTHIVSANSMESPAIRVNYLQTDQDKHVAVAAFRRARDIVRQPALQAFIAQEMEPGELVESDDALLDYICRTGEPVHHLAGSCRMGQDELAVVDARLCVHGIHGLRVADASVMPSIVSGNTHAACVMIGERVAAFILEE